MQSSEDKINSKDITEIFFSVNLTQIVERMCTVKFLIDSEWRSPIIVTRPNVFWI